MTLGDLRVLDALAFNAEQTGHGQAWDEMVDGLAGGQSERLRLYLKAVNPQAVQQLIKALRKMADGYAGSWCGATRERQRDIASIYKHMTEGGIIAEANRKALHTMALDIRRHERRLSNIILQKRRNWFA